MTVEPPLGSKENPIIIEDDDDFPNEGRTENYHVVNGNTFLFPYKKDQRMNSTFPTIKSLESFWLKQG